MIVNVVFLQSNFTCCQGKSQQKVLRRDSNTVQTRYEVKLSTNPNRTKCPRPHPLPAKPPYQTPGRRRFAMCSNHPDAKGEQSSSLNSTS